MHQRNSDGNYGGKNNLDKTGFYPILRLSKWNASGIHISHRIYDQQLIEKT